MRLIDNINQTLRDDLVTTIKSGSRVSIVAASFSIYVFQELKEQLKDIDELRFIFTSHHSLPRKLINNDRARHERQIAALERQMNATKPPRRKRELFVELYKLKSKL